MIRSKWKGFFVDVRLLKKFDEILIESLKKKDFLFSLDSKSINQKLTNIAKDEILNEARFLTVKFPIEVWSRNSTILPIFYGFTFSVYNGIKWQSLKINPNMFFNKFGNFVFTKRTGILVHTVKKKKKKVVKKKRR